MPGRSPAEICSTGACTAAILGWFFPVMIVLMFGLLFGGAIQVPEGESYFDFLMPGMFATMFWPGGDDDRRHFRRLEGRHRPLPVAADERLAVVLGRCLADMLNSIVGLAVLMAAGLLLGWRWHGSLAAALAAVGLLLLLRFQPALDGHLFRVGRQSPESVTGANLVWPVSFLSNVFVDPATMPSWLGTIALWNPLSATTTATRELFGNPGWQSSSWISENALLMAILWPLLVAVFLPLSVRAYLPAQPLKEVNNHETEPYQPYRYRCPGSQRVPGKIFRPAPSGRTQCRIDGHDGQRRVCADVDASGRTTEVKYPGNFHIGFFVESEAIVDEINCRLKDDGYNVAPPGTTMHIPSMWKRRAGSRSSWALETS